MWRWNKEKIKDNGIEDCNGVATSHGMLAVPRRQKSQEMDFPEKIPVGALPW
jgi:hypothetical protein